MSSGLRSSFSRPRKTNGATPNAAGVFTTPTEKFANFSSPAVSQRILHAGFFRTPEVNNLRYTQVRTARQQTRPASPASSSRHSALSAGGRHGILARKQNPVEIGKGSPVPCDTLQARLSVASQEAAELKKKTGRHEVGGPHELRIPKEILCSSRRGLDSTCGRVRNPSREQVLLDCTTILLCAVTDATGKSDENGNGNGRGYGRIKSAGVTPRLV